MYWFLIGAALLIAAAVFLLLSHSHSVEDRCRAIERELAELRSKHDADHETSLGVASDASEAARRAHVRLDNHHRQIVALGQDIGWSDERAHTRMLTGVEPARSLPAADEHASIAPAYEELFGKNELDALPRKKA